MGVRTIVNFQVLEGAIEQERHLAEPLGIRVISLPINPAWPSFDQIEKGYDTVVDPANQPVFFHCRQGKDRTGTIAALYRTRRNHWSVADAYGEMARLGYNPFYFVFRLYLYSAYDEKVLSP